MTNLNISNVFKNCKKNKKPALITYTVAGDWNKKKSLQILKSVSKYANILELGFPHSTPIGDGGKIQTSSFRSINNGFKMRDAFQIVNDYKKIKNSKPVILMGYYNMIFRFGENRFLKYCKKFGVELFSGEFWSGSKAKYLGLIDEVGDANQVLRKKFGEDVVIKKFEKSKGWLSKKLSSSSDQVEQLANILDEKSVWQRYGL